MGGGAGSNKKKKPKPDLSSKRNCHSRNKITTSGAKLLNFTTCI